MWQDCGHTATALSSRPPLHTPPLSKEGGYGRRGRYVRALRGPKLLESPCGNNDYQTKVHSVEPVSAWAI